VLKNALFSKSRISRFDTLWRPVEQVLACHELEASGIRVLPEPNRDDRISFFFEIELPILLPIIRLK
jgi:hypothetical protein